MRDTCKVAHGEYFWTYTTTKEYNRQQKENHCYNQKICSETEENQNQEGVTQMYIRIMGSYCQFHGHVYSH